MSSRIIIEISARGYLDRPVAIRNDYVLLSRIYLDMYLLIQQVVRRTAHC